MKLTDEQVRFHEETMRVFDPNTCEHKVAESFLRLNTPEQPELLQTDPDALLGQRERPSQISEAVNWRNRALAAERELGELKETASKIGAVAERLRALISQKEGV